ncbi:MAG: hypothetical protein HOM55_07635, partial [Proteobacteria bacterium]|nr:hypothetical protein [Pseudomonadota bacterium]
RAIVEAEQTLTVLQDSEDWESVALNAGYSFTDYIVSRIDNPSVVDNEILASVFQLDRAGVGKFHQIGSSNGVALVYLNGIGDVASDTVAEVVQDDVRQVIRSRFGQGLVNGVIESARDQADLTINEDLL